MENTLYARELPLHVTMVTDEMDQAISPVTLMVPQDSEVKHYQHAT